jgi:hypothetical protein
VPETRGALDREEPAHGSDRAPATPPAPADRA